MSFLTHAFLVLLYTGCRQDSPDTEACTQNQIVSEATFLQLIQGLPQDVVTGLLKNPTPEGALGRNREGYFHVRFQMDITWLAAYAVRFESEQALDKFILAAEYSFAYQKEEGDFELIIPENLAHLGNPTEADLSSGVSFFASALGSGLILLNQSEWYRTRPEDELTDRLRSLHNKFQQMLDFLKTKKEILNLYDREAPNRLLFNALAFYGMGQYLNDREAMQTGVEFMNQAMALQSTEGYLTEGGGFDSSYNGVALRLGFVLLGALPTSDPVFIQLQQSMSCCAQWQSSRVLPSGEISTEGNTRVYPGGEDFLGEEKGVAWTDSCLSFYFFSVLTQQTSFTELAERIKNYYN